MLRINRFTKTYGNKVAVDNLNLHIAPGEIFGFIGHNGAGKTTTLKACCGILQFDQGEITVCGHSIRKEPLACKQSLAYIPDNPDLYEFLTGLQYLSFVADIYGISKADRQAGIQKYGGLLGMTDDLSLPISQYSHGMKQKVAVMSALIHRPKLILMDEPFVGLDPLASHQLKNVMAQHCAAGGAIFFSTHVLEVAEKLCHKVAIIKNGKLVAAGPMEEVRGNASLEEVFLELEGQPS
ncbi:MAG TPA: ABC transporter ATP-binding protein [Candidatus Faecousia faecigallinarum]|nr:ABC transporter ATP-binding protein [Candidatus Faecousia faecigallinarum]